MNGAKSKYIYFSIHDMKNICLHFTGDRFTFSFPNATMYRIGDKRFHQADFDFQFFKKHYEKWLSNKTVKFVLINPLHWVDYCKYRDITRDLLIKFPEMNYLVIFDDIVQTDVILKDSAAIAATQPQRSCEVRPEAILGSHKDVAARSKSKKLTRSDLLKTIIDQLFE